MAMAGPAWATALLRVLEVGNEPGVDERVGGSVAGN
jgi:hypothetical protein